MIYHSAIREAARQRGLTVALYRRGDEVAHAAKALHCTVRAVERTIRHLRGTLGSPWTADHRWALAAAIAATDLAAVSCQD
jgi:hypothetical protein